MSVSARRVKRDKKRERRKKWGKSMKKICWSALPVALILGMLGGCTEKPSKIEVSAADFGEKSVQSSSSAKSVVSSVNFSKQSAEVNVGTAQTKSSRTNSIPQVVIPDNSGESTVAESADEVPNGDSVEHISSVNEPPIQPSQIEPPTETLPETEKPTESAEPVESEAPKPSVPSGTNSYQALNYSEVKGIWISYLELAELSSDTESEFRNSIGAVYDNCTALGINTVFVHVRSHGDAYYDSALYPRTKYLGGGYDPLAVMIEEAHSRSLSFQAWINPLRACSTEDIERESGYKIYDWAGGETRLVTVGDYYYLNPAYEEVTDFIAQGAAEIAANYDVDGVHIDDYFYPTTEEQFDSAAYSESSYNSLSDFRLANCDRLVSSLYKAVKNANSSALFGVSPQGNLQNNYDYMYADVEKWCTQSGYLDYIMPQIYFGFRNSAQPFVRTVKEWDNLAVKGAMPLIVGLSPSKIGAEDAWAGDGRYEWITDQEILKRQFSASCEAQSYGGVCLYSYNSVFNTDSAQLDKEIEALKTIL